MISWLPFAPPGVTDIITTIVLLVLTIISWYYHFGIYGRIRLNNPYPPFNDPVSVVVCARNELQNLQKNLPLLLTQEYREFELIVADDGSTDGSTEWLISYATENPRLKLVILDPEYIKMHGKKIALTLAFKKARHNYFVLTDADCSPVSNEWLHKITSGFSEGNQVIIGYSPYKKSSGFLNKLIRYETLSTALNCFGFAGVGKAYMGVGRNLAYTRAVYEKVQGFSSHSHIPAGDDDLFVQGAVKNSQYCTILEPESFVESEPKTTVSAWWKQKRRHMWVGKYYETGIRQRLAVLPMTQWLFTLISIAWFFYSTIYWFPLIPVLFRWLPEWYVKARKSKIFACRDLVIWMPLLSLVHQFLYVFIGIGAFFAKKPKW